MLSQRQLSSVATHVGNNTEAARAAGYKNPERSAPRLMAIPAVRQAIKEKQKAIIEASGAKIGRHLTKIDVVARLSNWPNYRQSAPDTISWAN
jgi:pyruvate/2-oxoglutarate dehydrogenase complex dihydrolipoamide acyltransferase (E2) component